MSTGTAPEETPPDATPEVEVTPEAAATLEPAPTPVPEATAPPAGSEDATQDIDPEPVPTPEDSESVAKVDETPSAETDAPDEATPDEDPVDSSQNGEDGSEEGLTEDDLSATVATIRSLNDEESGAEETRHWLWSRRTRYSAATSCSTAKRLPTPFQSEGIT